MGPSTNIVMILYLIVFIIFEDIREGCTSELYDPIKSETNIADYINQTFKTKIEIENSNGYSTKESSALQKKMYTNNDPNIIIYDSEIRDCMGTIKESGFFIKKTGFFNYCYAIHLTISKQPIVLPKIAANYYTYLLYQLTAKNFMGTKLFCKVLVNEIKAFLEKKENDPSNDGRSSFWFFDPQDLISDQNANENDCNNALKNSYPEEDDKNALNNICTTENALIYQKQNRTFDDGYYQNKYRNYHIIMAYWFSILDPQTWCRHINEVRDPKIIYLISTYKVQPYLDPEWINQ